MVIKIIVINLILNIVITAIFIYILLQHINKKILNQFNDSKIKIINDINTQVDDRYLQAKNNFETFLKFIF
jgi:hypothetical protein